MNKPTYKAIEAAHEEMKAVRACDRIRADYPSTKYRVVKKIITYEVVY